MKFVRLITALLLSSFLLGACSDYNKTKIKEMNTADDRIFGDAGGPPRQMANTYAPNAKTADRVKAIREKLYPTK